MPCAEPLSHLALAADDRPRSRLVVARTCVCQEPQRAQDQLTNEVGRELRITYFFRRVRGN